MHFKKNHAATRQSTPDGQTDDDNICHAAAGRIKHTGPATWPDWRIKPAAGWHHAQANHPGLGRILTALFVVGDTG
jgi:hypothetical protein